MTPLKLFEKYYQELLQDIYDQPDSDGHTDLTEDVLNNCEKYLKVCAAVLDVGCGQGFSQKFFEYYGLFYVGITLGRDYHEGKSKNRNIFEMDYNDIQFPDDHFDLIFSRHSLEHSPFPLLTLMEWHRVGRKYLLLVLPNPNYYSWSCPNHYGIMSLGLAKTLCHRAGWKPVWEDDSEKREFRIICEKVERTNKFYRYNEENIDGEEEEEIPEETTETD